MFAIDIFDNFRFWVDLKVLCIGDYLYRFLNMENPSVMSFLIEKPHTDVRRPRRDTQNQVKCLNSIVKVFDTKIHQIKVF